MSTPIPNSNVLVPLGKVINIIRARQNAAAEWINSGSAERLIDDLMVAASQERVLITTSEFNPGNQVGDSLDLEAESIWRDMNLPENGPKYGPSVISKHLHRLINPLQTRTATLLQNADYWVVRARDAEKRVAAGIQALSTVDLKADRG
jgi:hypothetical protein